MVKMVQQCTVTNGKISQSVRYDPETSTLYRQNRSYDQKMTQYEYLLKVTAFAERAKKEGWTFKVCDVPIGSNWPKQN